jgi:hypothetical protein
MIKKLLLLPFLILLPTGCQFWSTAAPVDAERGRQALTSALEHWKKQTPLDAMPSQSPPILVQDSDWEFGRRLISYKILHPGKEEDMHLRCPVELLLRDQDGREERKTVRYTVLTSPTLKVFREVLP